MKRLFLLAALLALTAHAEPKFNALDPIDPHYAEYQRNLCTRTATDRDLLEAGVYWLTNRNIRLTPPTAYDYILSQVLFEHLRFEYDANCLPDANH